MSRLIADADTGDFFASYRKRIFRATLNFGQISENDSKFAGQACITGIPCRLENSLLSPNRTDNVSLVKRSHQRISLVSTAAAALLVAAPMSSAHADNPPQYAGCTTTGASGSATFNNPSAVHVDIEMNVSDIDTDNHHVAIRFVSDEVGKPIQYWPWHHNYKGAGKTINVSTYADTSRGYLNYKGVQVATMEGSTVLHSCIDWVGGGP
ncbi:hypothetical protein ABZ915_10080 [Streptomyces sp. NPDC046915]|uniref:hypothetical protein n=1 Tax=Streptomyces sp. NPDC046915 TaxID=3155257 RepID=UPI0033E471A3